VEFICISNAGRRYYEDCNRGGSFVEQVKVMAWKWLREKGKRFNHSISEWKLNPLSCMGFRIH